MSTYLSTQWYTIYYRTRLNQISESLFGLEPSNPTYIYITKRIPNSSSLSAILAYHIPEEISLINHYWAYPRDQ